MKQGEAQDEQWQLALVIFSLCSSVPVGAPVDLE